ncbi:secretory lipase [Neofusicoccum parvum]|uniref:Secretory lipase n=1 Tax=Neofusicoccum parvum TaxID=310453 RepID=A0ACB5SD35_9PEZI|nr:secretory lipase [Neofusicoccum parvum]
MLIIITILCPGQRERDYAVVATDYAGLGPSYTEHRYCSFPAHANDVFYSVTAARQAFGAVLSAGWLAVGYSEGGGAAPWKLPESIDAIAAAHGKDQAARYLGTVALALATKIWDIAQLAAAKVLPRPDFHAWAVTSLLPYLYVGAHGVFPNVTDAQLGGTMKSRMGLADEA